MAVFKKYAPGYEKDGYYVHISIPGADHPIPLQTPDEIAEFYKSVGYDAGDKMPDELVWVLYELDLHWTGKSGISRSDASKPAGESPPVLTRKDVERIRQYVDSYSGEYAEDLEKLGDRIEASTAPEVESEFDLLELLDRTPTVDFDAVPVNFTEETKERIQQWLPPEVMNKADRMACDEHLEGEIFVKSPQKHLSDLFQTPDYESLLDSHAAHPWTVTSIKIREDSIVDSTDDPDQMILTAEYNSDSSSTDNSPSISVQDLRQYETSSDFELAVSITSAENRPVCTDNIAVAISDGEITDFTVTPVFKDPGRFDRDAISEFAAEYTDASPNSVTHSLVISFAHHLPLILEYCNAVPDYEMCSTDPDANHFNLILPG